MNALAVPECSSSLKLFIFRSPLAQFLTKNTCRHKDHRPPLRYAYALASHERACSIAERSK